jgi:PAS domain S-box-containing protein
VKKNNHLNIEEYRDNPIVQELLEASNDGFWDWNIATGEVYFSKRWAEMLGYRQEEIEPHVRSWELLVHPDDMAMVTDVLQKHLSGQSQYYETVHRVRTKNGDWKWILDRGRVIIRDENGQPLRAAGSHTDITDKKRHEEEREKMEEQLRQAVQARDEFLSIASHELKTPLAALLLQVQLIKRNTQLKKIEELHPDRLNEFSHLIEQQIKRLVRLVDDMLDMSRILSKKLTIKKEEFDFGEEITQVSERLDVQIKMTTGVPLQIDVLPTVRGNWDRQRIEQVITNLISNALKYGLSKPINVGLIREGNQLRFYVKDQGQGIAKENLVRIFNRFERAVPPNEVSGLGLGLYISKQIIESHHGRIWAESELGSGSTFWLELPLYE